MPRPPRANDKINYILHFFMDACDAPVTVYVKTLLPALIEAFATWYALDAVQIFTAWSRPASPLRGVRGAGHGRSRKREPKDKPGSKAPRGRFRTYLSKWRVYTGFDPWDWMGRNAPGAGVIGGATKTPSTVTMWNLYGLEQRILYWFFVYELVEEFFYKWASGVAQSWYCQQQYTPIVVGARAAVADPGLPGGTGILIDQVLKARHGFAGPGNNAGVDSAFCDFSAKAKRSTPEDGHLHRLIVKDLQGGEWISNTVSKAGEEMVVSGTSAFSGTIYVFYDAVDWTGSGVDFEVTVVGAAQDATPYQFPPDWREPEKWEPGAFDRWTNALAGNYL